MKGNKNGLGCHHKHSIKDRKTISDALKKTSKVRHLFVFKDGNYFELVGLFEHLHELGFTSKYFLQKFVKESEVNISLQKPSNFLISFKPFDYSFCLKEEY